MRFRAPGRRFNLNRGRKARRPARGRGRAHSVYLAGSRAFAATATRRRVRPVTRFVIMPALAAAIVITLARAGFCTGQPLEPSPSSCARVAREFVSISAPGSRRYFDFFRTCGDLPTLAVLLDALTRPHHEREPLELAAAAGATLNSAALAHSTEAAAMLARAIPAMPDPRDRAMLAHTLAAHEASAPLIGMLRHDPSPEVRAVAAQSLGEYAGPLDSDPLFAAARTDPDAGVRASAWLALMRRKQVQAPSDLLAALNAQRNGAAIVQVFDVWNAAVHPLSVSAYASRLVTLAQSGTANEAVGALNAIAAFLTTGEAGAPSAPGAAEDGLVKMRKALMPQRAVIARAALGRFAASAALDEDAARIAFVAFAAASGCDAGGQCPDVGRILTAIDRLPAPLATEASAMLAAIPSSGYVNQRWRQYLAALTVAVAILLVALAVSFVLGWRGLRAATIAGICALGLGAVLQFYAAGTTALSWPPLKVWPATFIGVVALTTLIAALIGLAAGRGLRRALAAIVAAEVLWWVVPEALTAAGVAVRMQHYRMTDDIVVMIAPIAGAFAVPFAAWAIAGLAAALAGLPIGPDVSE